VAQLEARLDGIEEVEGSNPFGSTKIPYKSRFLGAQIGVEVVRFKAVLSSEALIDVCRDESRKRNVVAERPHDL
jgi:hypothetical protein